MSMFINISHNTYAIGIAGGQTGRTQYQGNDDELCMLREMLETSDAIRRYVWENRPRHGGRVRPGAASSAVYLHGMREDHV